MGACFKIAFGILSISLQIDFASRDCQTGFFEKMERSGQLRRGDRPDERRGSKSFQGYQSKFDDDYYGRDEGYGLLEYKKNQNVCHLNNIKTFVILIEFDLH